MMFNLSKTHPSSFLKTGFLFLLAIIFPLVSFAEDVATDREPALYQLSTISGILNGVLDGQENFGVVKSKGTFGIGTLEGLDGEMVALDGIYYQVNYKGEVHEISDEMTTPFVSVVQFEPEITAGIGNIEDFVALRRILDEQLPSQNWIYAMRVEGRFGYVKTRSVAKQSKPYPPLTEVAKNQQVFEFENVEGVLVGFWFPRWMGNLNVPGYHFHFLTKDRTGGGHVLELSVESAEVVMDVVRDFEVHLPEAGDFAAAELNRDQHMELVKAE